MRIQLIKNAGEEPVEVIVMKLVPVESLVEKFKDEIKYRPMLAKIDGLQKSLTTPVGGADDGETVVELIAATTQSGNLVYQHTLSMVFLKAVKNILGNVVVRIQNPLNKGLFIRIDTEDELLDSQIELIYGLMKEYVRRRMPIEERRVTREEAITIFRDLGYDDKALLIQQAEDIDSLSLYYLGDYVNSFYGIMAPSTEYVGTFELMRYEDGVLLRHPYTDDPDIIPEYRDDAKLYRAFAQVEEWDRLLGINYVSDLNKVVAGGGVRDMILLSEALHEKRVAEIADMIKESGKRIVLIAGPSSSGKTSFAKRLCVQLRVNGIRPLYMGTDDYFVEREETPLGPDGKPDFENLNAMDIELFNSNMNDLLQGREVDMPTFDFKEGKKIFGRRITRLEDNAVMVIEGIHALNEAMSTHIDEKNKFKIYISPLTQLNIDVHNRISTTDARMLRRMVRDYKYRNHSAEETIIDWPKVRAGEDKNIFPYNGEADVLFNSVTIYELALLKKYAQPLLEKVPEESECYGEARRLIEFLHYFRPMDGEEFIPNNSILREFIGGSILLQE